MPRMSNKKAAFIGGGNIAEAFIRGFITSAIFDPGDMKVADKNEERLEQISSTLGVGVSSSNIEAARHADFIFLCVKPGLVLDVVAELASSENKHLIRKGAFIVSVAAGKSLASIRQLLPDHVRTVRIMPNLAAGVRKSTISLYADPALAHEDISPILSLLSNLGRVYRIQDERLMAMITALSGSAPAYYVMLADALIEFGVREGLDRDIATQMILSTMEGSAEWAMRSKVPLADLWKKVVTPGGTTQAGIDVYDSKGLIDIFIEGLEKATIRARELGDR